MKGDLMELVMPSGNVTFELNEIINKNNEATDVAPGSGHVVSIAIPDNVDAGTIDKFAMLVRYLPRL
jgi:putative protease